MVSGGHNKKPTALKILQGTARRDRMNPDEPTLPAVSDAPAPAWLDPLAKRHWTKTIRILYWLTEADLDKLALYCQAYARYRDITKLMDTYDVGSPAFAGWEPRDIARVLGQLPVRLREAESSMIVLGASLGLDPVGRSRIKAKKPDTTDAFEEWEKRQG